MNTEEFKEKVQAPYKQVWTIVLLAQQAIYSGNDEDWERYANEADRFAKEGINNPFQSRCAAFIYDAVDDMIKMNKGGNV